MWGTWPSMYRTCDEETGSKFWEEVLDLFETCWTGLWQWNEYVVYSGDYPLTVVQGRSGKLIRNIAAIFSSMAPILEVAYNEDGVAKWNEIICSLVWWGSRPCSRVGFPQPLHCKQEAANSPSSITLTADNPTCSMSLESDMNMYNMFELRTRLSAIHQTTSDSTWQLWYRVIRPLTFEP